MLIFILLLIALVIGFLFMSSSNLEDKIKNDDKHFKL